MTQDTHTKTYDPDALRDPNTAEPQFVLPSWIACAPFEQLCELEIVSAAEGEALLRMPFKIKHAQGGGLLHGGAITTLADTAVAMAIKSRVPGGTRFATIDLTTRFLAPVSRGPVEARARISRWDGRDLAGEAQVTDATGQVVAEFSSRFWLARADAERLHAAARKEQP